MRMFIVMIGVLASALFFIIGCNQTTAPDAFPGSQSALVLGANSASNAAGEITNLLIATPQGRVIREFNDPATIKSIVTFLSGTEQEIPARKDIIKVQNKNDLGALAVLVDFDPAAVERGLLIVPYTAVTWGLIKCCYAGDDNCCRELEKKKKEH